MGGSVHLIHIGDLEERKRAIMALIEVREPWLSFPGNVLGWREGIEDVVHTPRVKSKSTQLTNEAKTILLEAAAGDGRIMHVQWLGGESIQANGKALIPENNHKTIALWVGGLEDLARRRFIKDCGHKREVFEVTREGYEAAEEMRDG